MSDVIRGIQNDARHFVATVLSVTLTETLFALVLFALWTFSCLKLTQFRFDWWLSLFTLVLCCVAQGFIVALTYLGTNHFDIDGMDRMGLDQLARSAEPAAKQAWMGILISLVATVAGRLCIVVFLNGVFWEGQRTRSYFLWAIAVSSIITTLVSVVLMLTECERPSMLWAFFGPRVCPHQLTTLRFLYFAGSWGAVCDMALAIYAPIMIWRMELEKRTKIGISALLSLSVLASICACIKTSQLKIMNDFSFKSFNSSAVLVSTISEQWITFIVACIPPAAPTLKYLFSHRSWEHRKLGSRCDPTPEAGEAMADAHTRRFRGKPPPTFGPRSLSHFRALAYAVGTVNDFYAMGGNSSAENMVKNARGIGMTLNVEVHFDPKEEEEEETVLPNLHPRQTTRGGAEILTFDRI